MTGRRLIKEVFFGLSPLPLGERLRQTQKFRSALKARIKQGEREEDVLRDIDPPEEICRGILEKIPARRKSRSKWQKLLLWGVAVLTSPLWAGALLLLLIVAAVLYIAMWLSVGVVFLLALVLAIGFVGGIVFSFIFFSSNAAAGGLQMGLSLISGSLSVVLLTLGVKLTVVVAKADRRIRRKTKELFRRRFAAL